MVYILNAARNLRMRLINPGFASFLTIIEQGLKLHEMRRTRPSLEDVFLELTTKEPQSNY